MNLDERLRRTAKKIKSLRKTISENARRIAEMRSAQAAENERLERLTIRINKLAEIAASRLRRLQGDGQPE
jgi:peptidoglycan hydrolase CwlO-like protein